MSAFGYVTANSAAVAGMRLIGRNLEITLRDGSVVSDPTLWTVLSVGAEELLGYYQLTYAENTYQKGGVTVDSGDRGFVIRNGQTQPISGGRGEALATVFWAATVRGARLVGYELEATTKVVVPGGTAIPEKLHLAIVFTPTDVLDIPKPANLQTAKVIDSSNSPGGAFSQLAASIAARQFFIQLAGESPASADLPDAPVWSEPGSSNWLPGVHFPDWVPGWVPEP